ncbi:MAG: hypothetical protein J0M18_19750 [Ignavibacteria bacterium]|nr:hypothetical protein [Ignavibacteria bacterium]
MIELSTYKNKAKNTGKRTNNAIKLPITTNELEIIIIRKDIEAVLNVNF